MYAQFTDAGGREVNEDFIGVSEKNGVECFVLCDGLGGHGRGEEASEFVVKKILEIFEQDDDFIGHLDIAFEIAQQSLLEEQKRKLAKFEMKTTLTVLVVDEHQIKWGHIGDSRVYYFKNKKVKSRTLDHSVPQMLCLAKEIKEKEIRNHPDRNKLLRVMGIEWGTKSYEISKAIERKGKQAFLLCSDGFWELIEEKEMSHLLKKSEKADEWLNKMTDIVKENGTGKNMDNFSAIAVIV